MFMVNQDRADTLNTNLSATQNTTYGIMIRGTTHFDFSDLFLYSPVLKFTKVLGPIDGYRMVKILNAYTLAFFDETLKGEQISLLNGPSPDYPEVTIEIRNP